MMKVILLAISLGLACIAKTQTDRLTIGDKVPDVSFNIFEKAKPAKASGYKKRLVILNFWATWCKPCRTELPQLLALEEPAVVFISTDEAWPVVEHFFDGKLPSRVALDAGGEARRGFGVTTLPDTYLIDATGRAVARFHGPRAWASSNAKLTLRRLLNR